MDIGTAITQTLSAVGVTAAEVSRRTGITPGTISSYQSGRTTPSLQALKQIAAALDVRLSEIIERAESCAGDEQSQGALGTEERRGEYRVPEGQKEGRMLAAFSALTDRQQRALLSFLEAMETK